MKIIFKSLFLILICNTFNVHTIEDINSEKFKQCIFNIVEKKHSIQNYSKIQDPLSFARREHLRILHLYSKGVFNLEIFADCLPKNWQGLSADEQNALKSHIQTIFTHKINQEKKSFDPIRSFAKEFLTQNPEQIAKNCVEKLTPQERNKVLENGLESNTDLIRSLFPYRTIHEAPEFLLFLQDLIINAILEQMALEEAESLALAAFMAGPDQRHNTGLAQTMAGMFGSEPKFAKNLSKDVPAAKAHPKMHNEPRNANEMLSEIRNAKAKAKFIDNDTVEAHIGHAKNKSPQRTRHQLPDNERRRHFTVSENEQPDDVNRLARAVKIARMLHTERTAFIQRRAARFVS